jgi:hypothetical protein
MANPVLAQMAVNASFAMHGRDAIYTPPGEDAEPVACRVLVGRPDATVGGLAAGLPGLASGTLEVRKSDIAAPVRGGVFAIDGGVSLAVASDPKAADDERLVWNMTVR